MKDLLRIIFSLIIVSAMIAGCQPEAQKQDQKTVAEQPEEKLLEWEEEQEEDEKE